MTKAELIEKIAKGSSLTKAGAGKAIEATIGAIIKVMKKGDKVTIFGLGLSQLEIERHGRAGIPELAKLLRSQPTRFQSLRLGKS